LKYVAGNEFSIWTTDSNYQSHGVYAASSTALKSLEISLQQDLNAVLSDISIRDHS
jgi:hypothetical protein